MYFASLIHLACATLSMTNEGAACQNVQDAVDKVMARNHIGGMAVAIIDQDRTEFCNYGYTSKNNDVAVTERSVFEVASITKTFTALLVGIMATDGGIELNAPITKYIPELLTNRAYHHIRIVDLLTHVSGLPLIFNDALTESRLVKASLELNLQTEPSTNYRYSNPAFALIGLAITRVQNDTFQNILNRLILSPMQMNYTSVDVKPEYRHLNVTGYNRNDDPVDFMQIGINNPAGGLKSNTYDLAKYLRMQMNGDHPTFQNALNWVRANYHCLYENGTYQQLGWESHPAEALAEKFEPDSDGRNIYPPHRLPSTCLAATDGFIDKTGNSPGVTSYLGYIPHKKVAVVVLANRALKPDIVSLGRYILRVASTFNSHRNARFRHSL